MKKLNKVNEINGQIIPYNHFYIPELRDKVDIRADYVNWVQQSKLINSVSCTVNKYKTTSNSNNCIGVKSNTGMIPAEIYKIQIQK